MNKLSFLKFDSLPSTNTYAKENIMNLSLPCIITADMQTAGRGRHGNKFYSPSGTGLYMTAVFEAPDDCSLLTPLAAVAVCKVLESKDFEPKIKWVNDIFIENKKICGILTEIFNYNNKNIIALGIGLNITTTDFPDELSCASSLGKDINKDDLAQSITQTILEFPENNKITSDYSDRLFIIGKKINYKKNNIDYSATVKGINDSCNLIVTLDDGSEDILSSGEISIKF